MIVWIVKVGIKDYNINKSDQPKLPQIYFKDTSKVMSRKFFWRESQIQLQNGFDLIVDKRNIVLLNHKSGH